MALASEDRVRWSLPRTGTSAALSKDKPLGRLASVAGQLIAMTIASAKSRSSAQPRDTTAQPP
eukprot:3005204-Pyramimonas_sp.AAC.1